MSPFEAPRRLTSEFYIFLGNTKDEPTKLHKEADRDTCDARKEPV